MTLDRLQRHIKLMGDLAVGAPLRGKPRHVQFPRAQCFQPGAPLTSRAGAEGLQFFSYVGCQRTGAASGREVESLGERFARGGAVTLSSQHSS